MKLVVIVAATLFACVCVVAQTQQGYIKVDDIVGGSAGAEHKGWSEILTFNWGSNRTLDARLRPSANAKLDPLTFTMKMDKACTKYYDRCTGAVAGGATATIELSETSGKTNAEYDFYRITLNEIVFSDHLVSFETGLIPTETFALYFRKMVVEHYVVNNKGAVAKTGEYVWELPSSDI